MSFVKNILFSNSDSLQLESLLDGIDYSRIFVLADTNTKRFCAPLLNHDFDASQFITVEPGEAKKNLSTADLIWQQLLDQRADRSSILLNLGGGVITDIGGFCAATYKRGIRFIQVPTTLLGMVDAAIGGKTGIDHHGLKNVVGTFSEPLITIVHHKFLETLPRTELINGLAEVIKYGAIADVSLLDKIESLSDVAQFREMVEPSARIKMEIVEKDPFETHLRKQLNFGHTVGHAIESLLMAEGKPIGHGEAVAAGMIMALRLSVQKCSMDLNQATKLTDLIDHYFERLEIGESQIDGILVRLKNDKKNVLGEPRMVLLTELGNCEINVPVTLEEIRDVISWYAKGTPHQ